MEHVDAISVLRESGAAHHGVLATAREMQNCRVCLDLPGVAKTDPIQMSKALKTGGWKKPDIFVRMFEDVIDEIEGEWEILALFFTLPDTGSRIASVTWVDNCYILADGIEQYKFMAKTLTTAILHRYGWHWKDDSLEIVCFNLAFSDPILESTSADSSSIAYNIVDNMIALGGALANGHPNDAL